MAQVQGVLQPYVEVGAREELLDTLYAIGLLTAPIWIRLPKIGIKNKQVSWTERGIQPVRMGLVGASASATLWSSSTTVTIHVSNPTALKIGDILRFDLEASYTVGTERVRITGISTSILTVTRGAAGAAETTLASRTCVRVGSALLSGGDAFSANATLRTKPSTYTQTVENTILVAGDAESETVVGGNLVTQELAWGLKEHAADLERILIGGDAAAGSATTGRLTDGLLAVIASEIASASGNILNHITLGKFLQGIYDNGGSPNLLACGSTAWRCFGEMVGSNRAINKMNSVGTFGMRPSKCAMQFGDQLVVLDPQMTGMLSSSIFALDTTKIRVGMKRKTRVENLAKNGDYVKKQILTEFAVIVANESAHGHMKGITKSA